MTAEQYRYPYLDSSVFIAWLKGELVNGVDRKEVADQILGSAKRETFRICISALTLAEVHKKRGHERLTEDEDTEILRFFEHDYMDVISVDRMIGERHIASAESMLYRRRMAFILRVRYAGTATSSSPGTTHSTPSAILI